MTATSMIQEARNMVEAEKKRDKELSIALQGYMNCLQEAISWYAALSHFERRKKKESIIGKMKQIQELVLELDLEATEIFNDHQIDEVDNFAMEMFEIRSAMIVMPGTLRREQVRSTKYRYEKWKKRMQKLSK